MSGKLSQYPNSDGILGNTDLFDITKSYMDGSVESIGLYFFQLRYKHYM